jgi:histidinol-phosphate phosphatase family protein
MQALILAGGKGTRLRERLGDLPKPLVDVDGHPLLQRQIEALRDQGIDDVVILVNYRAKAIEEFCAQHENFGIRITILDDGEPRGTAGAVLAVLPVLADEFIVLYGDTLLDVDFHRFVADHRAHAADVSLFVHPNDHPSDSDLVELDGSGWVTRFHKYPHPPGTYLRNIVNAALYVMRRDAISPYDGQIELPCDFAKDLFPRMVEDGRRIRGYLSFEYIKDIGTPGRLDKAVGHLRTGQVARARLDQPQKVVFLDRDGTINEEVGHLSDELRFALLPGVASAIRRLNEAEFRCVVVTNQPVLARGDCTAEGLSRIHAKMEHQLGLEGAYLDLVLYCPHHPDRGFPGEVPELKRDCDCRKPATGMIDQVRRDMVVDMERSWVVGDTTSDVELARRAGLRSILVRTGHAGGDGKFPVSPDHVAASLSEAVDLIVNASPVASGTGSRGQGAPDRHAQKDLS